MGQFGPENKLIERQPNEYDVIYRNASVLAFHMWPTIFAGAPFRLQNIYRNGVPPRSRTNTPLGPPCSGIWQLHDAFIGHASPSCLAAANTFSSVQFVCSCERAFKPTCRKLIVLAVFSATVRTSAKYIDRQLLAAAICRVGQKVGPQTHGHYSVTS